MKTIVLWVLFYGYAQDNAIFYNYSVAIPGIASEAECKRLGETIAKNRNGWLPSAKYRCESYVAGFPDENR